MSIDPKDISQEEFEAIEQYLHDEMSEEHRAAFEKRLEEDPQLRQTVYKYQQLMDGVETASLKMKLDEFHAEIEEDTSSSAETSHIHHKKNRAFLKFLVAASIFLAFGLIIWFVTFQSSPEEELFAAYFEPDPGLITPMSSTNEYEFYSGMIDYKQENYQKAITRWEPLITENPQSDTLNYFLGVAHLALGDQEPARTYLEASLETPEESFTNETYYYLALAYLKSGNRSAAVDALRESGDERAASLLTELEAQE